MALNTTNMKKYIVYINQKYNLSDWKLVTEEYYINGELHYSCGGIVYSTSGIRCSQGIYRIDYK